MRYDLTVPFARYLGMQNIMSMKRYNVGKVYRMDNPSKGQYSEFYQCDFDIAGTFGPMQADWEVLVVLTELLDRLKIGSYEIKLNHMKLLEGVLDICGVPPEKLRTVCSSINKLKKQTFDQVKKELVEEKGITEEIAEKIRAIVKKHGDPFEVLNELKSQGSECLLNSEALIAINELEILFNALESAKCLDKISFDLSLARNFDYYTGVIFETILKGDFDDYTQGDLIAAGGRYDNLVGMFSGTQVPAVGVSFQIERIVRELGKDYSGEKVMRATTKTQVLVSTVGKDLNVGASLVKDLWASDISAELMLKGRVMEHLKYAERSLIPWIACIGNSEIKEGIVLLRSVLDNRGHKKIAKNKIVDVIKSEIGV